MKPEDFYDQRTLSQSPRYAEHDCYDVTLTDSDEHEGGGDSEGEGVTIIPETLDLLCGGRRKSRLIRIQSCCLCCVLVVMSLVILFLPVQLLHLLPDLSVFYKNVLFQAANKVLGNGKLYNVNCTIVVAEKQKFPRL